MSASPEDFSAWTPPGGGSGGPPGPSDKFWLFLRLLGVAAAETFNWFVHVANYSLANPIGSDLFVIATEFSALYLRVQAENAPSPIIDSFNPSRSFWPMLIMSVSMLLINAGMGLASAHILRSVKAALKGE